MSAFLLSLLVKMMTAAAIVVIVSMIAERAQPFLAAMIATLPVSAGPSLVFLALEHDDAFIRATLVSAMVSNVALGAYVLLYTRLAQRWSMLPALVCALLGWVGAGVLLRPLPWSLPLALAATLLASAAVVPLVAPYTRVGGAAGAARGPLALLLRAGGVALLVALVTLTSARVGPYVSAYLAAFPIVLSSLIVILHRQVGGPASAAMIASTAPGLAGFGLALGAAAASVEALGRFPALGVGLAVAVAWNGALTLWRLRSSRPPAP